VLRVSSMAQEHYVNIHEGTIAGPCKALAVNRQILCSIAGGPCGVFGGATSVSLSSSQCHVSFRAVRGPICGIRTEGLTLRIH
jgi:hypothetical protein